MQTTTAFAAPPEKPELTVEGVRASEASFRGVLSPDATEPNKGGSYRFVYRVGSVCTGGSETGPGLSLGAMHEELPLETVTGLTQETEYSVCLSVTDLEGQTTLSAPVSFETAHTPETPTAETASAVGSSTAKLEGILNAGAAGSVEGGEYEFEYRASESECEGERVAPEPAGVAAGEKAEAVKAELKALQPHQKYTFCLVERNAAGEEGRGVPVSFETKEAPPSVQSESAEAKAEEARLNATVNPANEPTECQFQYGTGSVSEHTVACEQGSPPGTLEGGEQAVGVTVTGLAQQTLFKYRVLVKNATGEEEGAGEFTTAIRPATPTGLQAKPVATATATLRGVLDPNAPGNPGSYEFLFKQSASECEGGESTPNTPALGGEGEAVQAALENLLPNTTYTFCLRVHDEVGEEAQSPPVTFTTLVAPVVIESESSVVVGATEARLEAQIDDGNALASYQFEYGPAAGSYDVSIPAPAGQLDGHTAGVGVSAVATGLAPGTAYHWRVVASNTLPGQTDGADREFTSLEAQQSGNPPECPNEMRRTEQPFAQGLPDCRAYEMVSPANTQGQDAYEPRAEGTPRAALSGEAITYRAAGAFADPAGAETQNQMLSVRDPAHGRWMTRSVTTPEEAQHLNLAAGYKGSFFTPELTAGLSVTSAALTGEAPQGLQGLYRADFENGSYTLLSKLAPSEEPYGKPYDSSAAVWQMGASEDLSHAVFLAGENERHNFSVVHEWVGGRVFTVDVSNTGQVWEAGVGDTAVSEPLFGDVWRAVSGDGSRVVFDRSEAGIGPLYVRQNAEAPQSPMNGEECLDPADACTILLSPGKARYMGASTDDTKIFYTENEDLYEYDLPAAQVSGQTTALTHEGKVKGVLQVSEDGSYVYFVAQAALAGGAVEGQPNLYVSHDAGSPTFIATLSESDSEDWRSGPDGDTAVAAPAGGLLGFVSERGLTQYDNEEAQLGDCETITCREVYLYDAETASLVCASCNPSGAAPVGEARLNTGLFDSDYRPRNLLEDGTLFFESSDALVTHASDGHQNVYEYEDGHVYPISNVAGGYESFFLDASPDGSDVFFATAGRLVPQAIGDNVVVYDARIGGGFPAPTSVQGCEKSGACKPPVFSQPEIYGAGPSETFNGPGNLTPAPPAPARPGAVQQRAVKLAKALKSCRKSRKKDKRKACEKLARKRYGAKASAVRKPARRVTGDGRGSR